MLCYSSNITVANSQKTFGCLLMRDSMGFNENNIVEAILQTKSKHGLKNRILLYWRLKEHFCLIKLCIVLVK